MRAIPFIPALVAAVVLAACAPPPPGSTDRGAGFETPEQYAARRDAELSGGFRQPVIVAPPFPQTEAERLALDTRAAIGAPRGAVTNAIEIPGPGGPTPVFGSPAPLPGSIAAGVPVATPDLDRDNPSLSREQDFGAVSAERSIQDDAARVDAARQQYQIVQPTELERPADDGPNIISYALERARPLGASGSFDRSALASERRAQSKCEGYRSADAAQEEFLGAGGPERDRLGLDPDGDGNACRWDPATFRNLVRN